MPYLASVGAEALGPVEARCPVLGNARELKLEGGLVPEHPHRGSERRKGMRVHPQHTIIHIVNIVKRKTLMPHTESFF